MIVITLTYVVPIERIDELRAPHLDWLRDSMTVLQLKSSKAGSCVGYPLERRNLCHKFALSVP